MPRNANRLAADAIVEELARAGVADACVSPGSRSSPLVLALARCTGIRGWISTDERCAGFFALGLARETGAPVALVCTSGTAAANYLPAVVEASLGNVPLVLLTADRPPELRDCGAAQTIRQAGLFTAHVRWSVDVATPATGVDLEAYYRSLACRAVGAAQADPPGPVHLNLPMREPLFDPAEEERAPRLEPAREPRVRVHRTLPVPTDDALEAIAERLEGARRGILVCGAGSGPPAALAALAAALDWPILADPLSGLRFGGHDRSRIVDAYDLLLRDQGFRGKHLADLVIRFGALPASKPIERFLAAPDARRHLLVAPPGTWPDPLHRATDVIGADPGSLCSLLAARLAPPRQTSTWTRSWVQASRSVRSAVNALLAEETGWFEGKVLATMQRLLPEGAALHVGNSMPVRDADSFLGASERELAVIANRGVNGIDGVVSTALGAAAAGRRPVALVVGDLSFLHDLGALQIAARYRIRLPVVVVDNDGGGIFSFLPQARLGPDLERWFTTPHGLDLTAVAAMCGATRVRDWADLAHGVQRALARGGLEVLVVPSARERNVARHREIVAAALARARAELGGWEAG